MSDGGIGGTVEFGFGYNLIIFAEEAVFVVIGNKRINHGSCTLFEKDYI
jgi:hypothetical protein